MHALQAGGMHGGIQGYLAHKKLSPARTLLQDYAWGPTVVLGGGAVSYERGTPVGAHKRVHQCPRGGPANLHQILLMHLLLELWVDFVLQRSYVEAEIEKGKQV